ncbi:MAG: hypothetical protein IJT56_07155 [Clostridia bacterium]|nr:hypothetical protein [Clostridia bacterium]
MSEYRFPFSFWNTVSIKDCVFDGSDKDEAVRWRDLGITVAMSPSCGEGDEAAVKAMLDRCAELGGRVILCEGRAGWRYYQKVGETAYRETFAALLGEYGSYPALFGFFVGDEPDAKDAADAFAVSRIQNEMAPHLTAYLNLLPWFDWIAERIGSKSYAAYLDRAAKESGGKLVSYDCYTNMWGRRGYDVYFNNLREHSEQVRRNGVPFWNIVLSCGHYEYQNPTQDHLWWEVSTSVTCGAAGVSYFFIRLPRIMDNYHRAAINMLNERTPLFGELSEVNRTFQQSVGCQMEGLVIDKLCAVGESFGGIEMFRPFGSVLDVKSNYADAPLLFSHFKGNDGGSYYAVCNNTPLRSTYVGMRFKKNVRLSMAQFGGYWQPMPTHGDPVGEKLTTPGETCGLWLAPGRMALIREEK